MLALIQSKARVPRIPPRCATRRAAAQTSATPAELSAAFTQTGAFALTHGSKDAALIVVLAPGAYTAIVSGVNGQTGVALVEIYEIPDGN